MEYRHEIKHEIHAGDKAAIIANLRAVARASSGRPAPRAWPTSVCAAMA